LQALRTFRLWYYFVTEPHTGAVGIPLNDCGSSGFRNIHQDYRQAVP
jgi:hypothetical protein